MRPHTPFLILAAIVACTIGASVHSYRFTCDEIVRDMDRALYLTLAEKRDATITPDTIADYRSHLRITALRRRSTVSYAADGDGLTSNRQVWNGHGKHVSFQGYANCSMAAVWALSDQRVPAALSLLAAVWAAFSVWWTRNRRHCHPMPATATTLGGLTLDADSGRFLTANREPVHLTPLQEKLMQMFFARPDHSLTKQEICDALWPKKPNASETLYTLIRRLKPVIEAEGNLRIVSERGKDYRLEARQ